MKRIWWRWKDAKTYSVGFLHEETENLIGVNIDKHPTENLTWLNKNEIEIGEIKEEPA